MILNMESACGLGGSSFMSQLRSNENVKKVGKFSEAENFGQYFIPNSRLIYNLLMNIQYSENKK